MGIWQWGPGQRGEAAYLRRQTVADRVHVAGRCRRVHEAVRVAGEAVARPVGRAGVGGCGSRGQAPLVHGGRREGLGPVHSAAPICGEAQERAEQAASPRRVGLPGRGRSLLSDEPPSPSPRPVEGRDPLLLRLGMGRSGFWAGH